MTKSSNVSRWPSLGHVREISDDPFIVGIYCGPGQPDNTYDVIADFVKETNGLEAKGIFINGNHVEVHVSAFIVDQPARTKLTGSVSHCSYHGCPRCTTKGVYVVRPNEKNGRVTFPETRAPRKTDESFRRREHPEHHSRDMGRSPVEDLRTNMVDNFPPEELHLLDLGATKKIILFLVEINSPARLKPDKRRLLSDRVAAMSKYIPWDFARDTRGFKELKRWKATEFRTFRNYLGIVVLKDIVSSDCYATDDLAHWNLKTKKINATNKGIRSGSFYLLGSPHRYNLSVTEQVTLLNSVAGSS